MCIVPKNNTQEYVQYISQYVGSENVYPLRIREEGAIHLASGVSELLLLFTRQF